MWEVKYSNEATNYLVDNGELVRELFDRIEGLAEVEGAPREGAHQESPDEIWWDIENHRVIYKRREAEQLIIVAVIYPL